MTFPVDSVQSIVSPSPWWEKSEGKKIERGCLVYAFVPHVDQVPYTIKPIGRLQADKHESAELYIAPLRMQDRPTRGAALPVAAMPLNDGELWAAYRAKKRPCLVLMDCAPMIDHKLRKGMPNKTTAPVVLVAPYYGADKDGTRAGYNHDLVERIRHAEYPQFFWDKLPIHGPKESILRLDQAQPVGTNYNSYELSGHKLSDDAMKLIDDFLRWLIWGDVPDDSLVLDYRKVIESTFP